MSDSKLRQLERIAAESNSNEDKQAVLRERKRTNQIDDPYWTDIIEHNGVFYRARLWGSRSRTDSYGNSPACNCADLMRVDLFCVCIGRAWCPTHGGIKCIGGHD